jgi:Fe-S-cluster-containing hydrogenase component 2
MATTITNDCINCGACEPECPNNAIKQGDPIYVIDPQLCTECVGFHDYEACAAVCPVDCCVTDPQNVESDSVLIQRARQLHKETDFGENYQSRFRKASTEQKASAPVAGADVQPVVDASVSESQPASPAAEPASAQPDVVSLAAEVNTEPAPKPAVSPAAESKPAPPSSSVVSPAAEPNAKSTANPIVASPATEAKPAATPSSAAVSTATGAQPIATAAAKASPAQAASKPGTPASKGTKPAKTFAKELPVGFEEASKRYTSSGSLNRGIGKSLVILAQPLLGALPHETKKRLEAAVQSPLFTAAGSTGLNIVQNTVLYPLICMAVAALLRGPSIFFSQEINGYVLVGFMLAAVEAVYRLKDGIFSPKPADEMIFRASVYGAPLGVVLQPLLEKQTGLIRDFPIPVDGFYSPGFVEKLERERRYGNVYTMEDRGGAFLLRMEFPRCVPDIGLGGMPPLPSEMPDYDYDLALQNGQFIVKGRCVDEQVRKISSSIGAFPPEFTTVIPLREKVTGFAHRFENKLLEVFLMKDSGSRWSESHH